ncbi:MAG: hypothetical protein H8E46_04610 [FCB group bacterium]|nr:hypothetical protein [FCB group bacterium]
MTRILITFTIILSAAFAFAGDKPLITKHDLAIQFDLENHNFQAEDKMIAMNQDKHFSFIINKDFDIGKIYVEGKKAKYKEIADFDWNLFGSDFESNDSSFFHRTKMIQVKLKKKYRSLESLNMVINYSGTLYDSLKSAQFSRTSVADQTIAIIGLEGIYLSPEAAYYPSAAEKMSMFSAELTTPEGYLTVTDGKLVLHDVNMGKNTMRWEGEAITDGLYISGGKWELIHDKAGEVDVYGFFFPEDQDISLQYVGAVKRYLAMYDGLIGKYPYSKFAVVENFFSTGYGMPSWTLLGKEVVRLPWIVHISLGHEVCHNWWGNGVFVDYKTGNWCEGLTTYCADYLYKERKNESEAVEYRRNLNQDYTAYVNSGNDFPLSGFRSRDETFTRTIGYGKSAMVFHMLRKQFTDEVFWKSLQSFYAGNLFKKASWNDIKASFEETAGEDLDWFFDQWVDQPGAPEIHLVKADLSKIDGQPVVQMKIVQKGDFKLNLPVKIYYQDSTVVNYFPTEAGVHSLSLGCAGNPLAVAIDPDFDVFRKLDRDEYPASLSEVFGASEKIIVYPSQGDKEKIDKYRDLANSLNRKGDAKVMSDLSVKAEDIGNSSYFILGTPRENSVYALFEKAGQNLSDWILFSGQKGNFVLMGDSFGGDDASFMIALRNPLNKENSVVFFSATSSEEISVTGKKLPHYGKYSYLAFEQGQNKLKGNWEVTNNPLKVHFK